MKTLAIPLARITLFLFCLHNGALVAATDLVEQAANRVSTDLSNESTWTKKAASSTKYGVQEPYPPSLATFFTIALDHKAWDAITTMYHLCRQRNIGKNAFKEAGGAGAIITALRAKHHEAVAIIGQQEKDRYIDPPEHCCTIM